jgi:multidrug transporter EmrE-like cation transporter
MPYKNIILYSIVLICIFESFGQYCLKQYEKNNLRTYFFAGIIAYFIVCCLLCVCYKNKANIGNVNLIWSCLSIITVISVGYLFLNEKIQQKDMFAIFFALLAIYFANQ